MKRTAFGTLFVVVAAAALEYVLFQITVTESIIRGVAIALGYLGGLAVLYILRRRGNIGSSSRRHRRHRP